VSSILGALMFIRLPWAVGEAGLAGVLLMLGLGTFVNVMTALSLSAICTNGAMKGGGAYFMISRSIGPELGTSTGLLFILAQCLASTFALVALAETVVDTFLCDAEPCSKYHERHRWLSVTVSCIALAAVLAANMLGRQTTAALSNVMTLVMLAALIVGATSILMAEGGASPSVSNLRKNLWFDFTKNDESTGASRDGLQSFWTVLVVVYPATTSVTAGASMSGQLKSPATSIPTGTLSAVAFTTAVYVALLVLFAMCFERHQLQHNRAVFRNSSVEPLLTVAGILACTLSSALGNLVGASSLLQALARDDLLQMLRPFAPKDTGDDNPRPALAACCAVIFLALMYGRLDAVAALVTQGYLLMYLSLNLACFSLRVTGAPNFRPRFRWFSWKTALAGAVSALTVFVVIDPIEALISLGLTAALSYYVHVTAPPVPWGDVSQALIYHQVRKYILRLDERRTHAKHWRPSILLIPDVSDSQSLLALTDFCNNLKKGGLFVIGCALSARRGNGDVVLRDMPNLALTCARLKSLWLDLINRRGIKGFYEAIVAHDPVSGVRSLIMSAGLGGLKCNTVCFSAPQALLAHRSGLKLRVAAPPPPIEECLESTSEASSSASGSVFQPHRQQARNPKDGGQALSMGQHQARERQHGPLSAQLAEEATQGGRTFQRSGSNALFDDEQDHSEQTTSGAQRASDASGLHRRRPPQVMVARNLATLAKCEAELSLAEEIQALMADHSLLSALQDDSHKRVGFCEMIADALVLGKNVLVTHRCEGLTPQHQWSTSPGTPTPASAGSNASAPSLPWTASAPALGQRWGGFRFRVRLRADRSDSHSEDAATGDDESELETQRWRRVPRAVGQPQRSTIDLWSTDQDDWVDPSGTLALGLQLAFSLLRTDAWEERVRLRVVAACQSVAGTNSAIARDSAKRAYETLRKLLLAIRVQADVVILPAVGAALFDAVSGDSRRDQRRQPLTQLEHCAELNAMILTHSSAANVVFIPLPRPLSHAAITLSSAAVYHDNLSVLLQGLPPTVMVCPGANIAPIVTTEL